MLDQVMILCDSAISTLPIRHTHQSRARLLCMEEFRDEFEHVLEAVSYVDVIREKISGNLATLFEKAWSERILEAFEQLLSIAVNAVNQAEGPVENLRKLLEIFEGLLNRAIFDNLHGTYSPCNIDFYFDIKTSMDLESECIQEKNQQLRAIYLKELFIEVWSAWTSKALEKRAIMSSSPVLSELGCWPFPRPERPQKMENIHPHSYFKSSEVEILNKTRAYYEELAYLSLDEDRNGLEYAYADEDWRTRVFDIYSEQLLEVEHALERKTQFQCLLGAVCTIGKSVSKKLTYKLVGSTWEVDHLSFWLHLLASISKNVPKNFFVTIETDQKEDCKNAFQNLRLPPPREYTQKPNLTSLAYEHAFLSAIGGVNADIPYGVNQITGGVTCEKLKKLSRKACRHGERQNQKLEKKLRIFTGELPKLSGKTLRWQKKLSDCYLGFINLRKKEVILSHLVSLVFSPSAYYYMFPKRRKNERNSTLFAGCA